MVSSSIDFLADFTVSLFVAEETPPKQAISCFVISDVLPTLLSLEQSLLMVILACFVYSITLMQLLIHYLAIEISKSSIVYLFILFFIS